MIDRLRSMTVKAFRQAEAASVAHVDATGLRKSGVKVMVICVTVSLCLTMTSYFSTAGGLSTLLGKAGQDEWVRWFDGNAPLARLVWWAGAVILFYLVVPVLVVKCVLREDLADYGFRLRGAFDDLPVYAAVLLITLPIVWVCSGAESFQARYPFYHPQAGESPWPALFLWEAFYLAQFAAVEFFFRGFMVHGMKERLGFYSVFVMIIPYCMVHFGKPLPETLAAIVAGCVLGVLSLKSQSIAPGFILHCGTALGMDLAALWRRSGGGW